MTKKEMRKAIAHLRLYAKVAGVERVLLVKERTIKRMRPRVLGMYMRDEPTTIVVNSQLPNAVVVGILAHEIGHHEDRMSLSFLERKMYDVTGSALSFLLEDGATISPMGRKFLVEREKTANVIGEQIIRGIGAEVCLPIVKRWWGDSMRNWKRIVNGSGK